MHQILNLSVPILLDKPRNLKIDFNALALIEEKGGRSMMSREAWNNLRTRDVRTLLFAALRHEDPDLSEKKVGAFLHMGNMKDVLGLLTQAWFLAFNGKEGAGIPPLEIRPAA